MTSRNQSLDVLRGIAILLVLGAHSDYRYVAPWRAIGASGVALFFVLSGFLISGLLFSEYQRTGHLQIVRFWIRRGFKIYPAFYLVLALRCLVPDPHPLLIRAAALVNFIFLQNYIHGAAFLIPQSWSLAVEEHFYFSLPLLLALLIRAKRLHWIPWLTVFTLALCTYLRTQTPGSLWHETHLSMDALLVGVALGYLKHFAPRYFPNRSKLRWLLIAAMLLLPVFVLSQTARPGPIATTVQFLGYAALLLWMVPRESSTRWPIRAIAWLGRYSYSIYLWHLVAHWVPSTFFGNTFVALISYFALAIGLGMGMAKVVEFPALRLRDRITSGKVMGRVSVNSALPCAPAGTNLTART